MDRKPTDEMNHIGENCAVSGDHVNAPAERRQTRLVILACIQRIHALEP
jgi:hypothetical protein